MAERVPATDGEDSALYARRRDRAARAQVARARGQGLRAHPRARSPRTSRRRTRWCRSIARAKSGRACSRPTRSSSAPTRRRRRRRDAAGAASRDRRAVRGEAGLQGRWPSPGRPRPTRCGPTDAGLQKNLERLAAEAEAWEELAEIYQAEVAKESRTRRARWSATGSWRGSRCTRLTSPRRRASTSRRCWRARPRTPRRCRTSSRSSRRRAATRSCSRSIASAKRGRHR